MLCIYHESTDPYFNVATDEYILKYLQEDCFMLWRNDNAIIIGQYQNALAEINYDYVKEHDIKVVRRLSGGGAVYHDLGNLNFSFTQSGKNSNLSDFKKFTQPIVDVLRELGANAALEGKNDLSIDGKKIAGNAAHIHKNKILSHGCLLFSSEMRNVSQALKINPVKYTDKAVKSVPKRVTNISEHIHPAMDVLEFSNRIMKHVISIYPNARPYKFTKEDLAKIQELRDEKYATQAWNFNKSPDYNFKKAIRTKGGLLEMNLNVKKGIIEKATIFGDFFSTNGIFPIEEALVGTPHEETAIKAVLSAFNIENHFSNITEENLIQAMF
ncbi:MAG TPA: lipoate--protein ligase [Chitinophagaceae bacterium]|nr:lipoate--protein ligase [Chitinophagaceae bacterium]